MSADLDISGNFGMYTLAPLTRRGRTWMHRHVDFEAWQIVGGDAGSGIAIDGQRMAEELAIGALKAGLRVTVDGRAVHLSRTGDFVTPDTDDR